MQEWAVLQKQNWQVYQMLGLKDGLNLDKIVRTSLGIELPRIMEQEDNLMLEQNERQVVVLKVDVRAHPPT